jgi:malonyl-CoA/methylmalonyl-CoA synthetase
MTDKAENIYSHFQKQFLLQGSKVVLTTESGKEYSYSDIDQESSRLAGFLTDLGVEPGDRVSVQVHKSPEAVCLYLACLRAGFVFHPLNTGYQVNELEYFLENAAPVLVVCDAVVMELITPLAKTAGVANVLSLNKDGTGSLIELSREVASDFGVVCRKETDLAALLYSSGTTGVPKGIMLTHNNLITNTKSLVEVFGFSDKDCLLHALPIFHVHGLFVALGCVFLSGASMQWIANFNVGKVIDLLPKCTVMMGVPTYYTRLLSEESFGLNTVKNIRLFVSGSAPLLEETFAEFEGRTGHRILERYGMTETNMNTSNPLEGKRKPGTVGLPLPGIIVRITDECGNEMSRGEVGNVQVKGPNVFKGYWKLPEKTAEDFTEDGYFNTGDKGYIDDEGYLSIVGRSKDMVITGGLNVYPKEIELLIDGLQGVEESAIIGLPHPDFGEGVVAIVVCDIGVELFESHIISEVKENMANFKVPKRVVFVDELPRNTMGKVQKNLLRDRYKNLLV